MPESGASTPSPRKLGLFGLVVAVGLAVVVITGITSRERSDARLREWTDAQAVPTVATAPPGTTTLHPDITLPGRLEAYSRAPILARVSGYLKGWYVDIGARVKAGQLLAEIEAPDLDQQLLQARADLLSAEASEKLAEATLKRRKTLASAFITSQQDLDERTADLGSKQASVKANQASVDRLLALSAYKRVTAPFDGIVTARNTDVGALINAGGNSGPPMFVISSTARLRVYVNVPQTFVPLIKVGTKAAISVPEYPNKTFAAVVDASSQAVDAASGSTRMLLMVDNPHGELMPGGYANVRIDLTRSVQPLHIPASALIVGQSGLRVATLDANDRIVFKTVTIARDLGKTIEIGSGLSPDDRVVITPPDGLNAGDLVHVAGSEPSKARTAARSEKGAPAKPEN
jgi:RND family efflux transporter MFP subunit